MYVYIYIYIYIPLCVYINVYIYIYIYIYIYMCVCVCKLYCHANRVFEFRVLFLLDWLPFTNAVYSIYPYLEVCPRRHCVTSKGINSTPPTKKGVWGMALNCVQWESSSSGVLRNVEAPSLLSLIPDPLWPGVTVLAGVPSMSLICLKGIYIRQEYLISYNCIQIICIR